MRVVSRTLVLALAASSIFASHATAQEDGVTLDPRDPAAKEYALPVESARRDASGEEASGVQHGSADSAPFGAGVTASGAPASGSAAGDDSASGAAATDVAGAPNAGVTSESGTGSTTVPGATPVNASADGPGSTATLLGGGLAALLIVGIGGLALRATRGPDPS
ncbi:MAG: hypothetical protein JHD16_04785 [Solirubrobacteraceae bacterium]|nr:hypothetical protein [Solirubrobacteraceae bacterium]